MSNFATRGARATKRQSAPRRTFGEFIHDHPAIFTAGLILMISLAPALVEWIAS